MAPRAALTHDQPPVSAFQAFLEASYLCEQADLLFGLNRYEQAAERYGQALTLKPDSVFALRGLAACHLNLGQTEEAEPVVHRLLQLDAENNHTCYLAAFLYNQLGRPAKAEEFIDKAIGRQADPEYFALKGSIHYQHGHFYEAKQLARKGLHLKPEHLKCRELEVAARYDLQEPFRAEAEALLQLVPDSARAHFFRGKAFFIDNHVEKAIEHFREAVRLDPNWPQALEALLEAEGACAESGWERLGRIMKNTGRSSRWMFNALPWALAAVAIGLAVLYVVWGLGPLLGGLILVFLLMLVVLSRLSG